MSDKGTNLKYEITEISHPKYPWLHRIRALRDVGKDVHAGDLGGYVQSAENLTQEGSCWLSGDAIACEDALVSQHALVSDQAVIRGSAYVGDSSRIEDHVVVEDHAIVTAGCVELNARISGNAKIGANLVTKHFPLITQDAIVYGEVRGKVDVCGHSVILPGAKIDMPTNDTLRIEDNKVSILRVEAAKQQGRKHRRSEQER